MKSSAIRFFAVSLACFIPFAGAFADSASTAEIVFVDGPDLTVLRGGRPIAMDDPLGFELIADDQIQTGKRTTAEILLKRQKAIVKLSENTILSLKGLGASSTTLELIYGRVRSKVEKLMAKDSFELRSSSVIAGVRGTDFGCDLIAPRSGLGEAPVGASTGEPLVRVYCFTGSVEVSIEPQPAAPITDSMTPPPAAVPLPPPILVEAGKMVTVNLETLALTPVLETKPLDEDLKRFWSANDFESSTVPPAPTPGAGAFDFSAARKAMLRKNASLAGGLALAAAGAALCSSSILVLPNDARLGTAFGLVGALFTTASVPVLIFSLAIDPLAGSKEGKK